MNKEKDSKPTIKFVLRGQELRKLLKNANPSTGLLFVNVSYLSNTTFVNTDIDLEKGSIQGIATTPFSQFDKKCDAFTIAYSAATMEPFLNAVKKLKPISFNVIIYDNYSISFSFMVGNCGYCTCCFGDFLYLNFEL